MLAIGAVTPGSARIWVKTTLPDRVRIGYWQRNGKPGDGASVVTQTDPATDNTVTATLPGADGMSLEPGTAYSVEARRESSGALVGKGVFETAPTSPETAPDQFSVAWMSCNQPFTENGAQATHATEMLQATDQCMQEKGTRLVFTLGDQMYTDYPKRLSLFDQKHFQQVRQRADMDNVLDANATEIRELLHERYRYFWNMDGWKQMHANFPCYPAIDDHEIIDNWGCNPDHSKPRWAPFLRGARESYFDYQGSRVHPDGQGSDSFDYSVEYGPLAAFVFDLRSQRRTGESARIIDESQFKRFESFLSQHAKKDVLLIALSVPIIHLPRWAARAGRVLTLGANEDFSDRWSTAGHKQDRDRVLSLLRAHQRENRGQQVYCISGDIHIACAHRIHWDDDTPPLTQLISSGITNQAGRITQLASRYSILANRRITLDEPDPVGGDVSLINGVAPNTQNPYTRLNLGMLEFKRGQEGRYATRALVHGNKKGAPQCVFRTPWRVSP